MRVLLTSDYGYYELTPVNKVLAKRQERNTRSESVIFQTDWDRPGLAESLGWNIRTAHKRNCPDVGSTDGTVTCRGCGRGVNHFINAATEWLDKRVDSIMQPIGIDAYFSLKTRNHQ